jgi:DNA polymerase III subunit epsilon
MWTDSWIAFDCETTGLDERARIVEIAVVRFERGVPVREWTELVCPPNVDWDNIDVRRALDVNKLTPEQLRGRPTFEALLPTLEAELSHDVWVAHNAEFDVKMVNQELARLGRPAVVPPLLVCTRNLGSHFNDGVAGNRLFEVAERYGIPQSDAHRAAVDARTCGLILAAMMQTGKLPTDDEGMTALGKTAADGWTAKRKAARANTVKM